MITKEYADQFIAYTRHGSTVSNILMNHGYLRDIHETNDNVLFVKENHSIGMTPGLDQSDEIRLRDYAKDRIMLVAEATNSNGDYVILEDDTGYMTLTGNLTDDLITYCRRVIKAIINVTGAAESSGMTPHDYITLLAD